jgi:RNA polymerase sigma-70 factor, ECF subfamily
MQPKLDPDLIAQGKLGDQAAIAELFSRHYPSSLRVARGILRSDESEDAVQVAYSSAFQHLHSFRGEACFKTWITRIVVNCCLLRLREARRRVTWVNLEDLRGGRRPDLLASKAPSPEEATWRQEIDSAFSEAVSTLPKPLREVYTLYSVSGLSLREVAATLGLTVPATKTRLFRARAGVRLRLKPMWPDSCTHGAAARSRVRSRASDAVSVKTSVKSARG